jgi:carbonic anhydrase
MNRHFKKLSLIYLSFIALAYITNLAADQAEQKATAAGVATQVPAPARALDSCIDGESPVNIIKARTHNLDLVDPKFLASNVKIAFHQENKVEEGKTIYESKFMVQVNPANPDAAKPNVRIDNENYNLLQFHFHAPSEHRIEGVVFPLEGHFVHKNAKGELAVIGLLFKEGAENSALKELIKIAKRKKNATINETKHIKFLLRHILPVHDPRMMRYHGSLTTPPFTRNVKWLLFKHIAEASKAQIDTILRLHIASSSREPQPLNKRNILSDVAIDSN